MLPESIAQLRQKMQADRDFDLLTWEQMVYRKACAQARREAQALLQALDEALLRDKPQGWQVVGLRPRSLVTRFGEVRFSRRLYRDPQGRYWFLLDEVLDLPRRQAATAEVTEAVIHAAAGMGFEQAREMLENLTAGVLSTSTVWRLLQHVGEAIEAVEQEEVEQVFEHGRAPRRQGHRSAERLYIEADGVMVRQRTGRGHTVWREVRVGAAYDEGGEARAYLQGPEGGDFWEGASLSWGAVWDWSQVQEVILNGDDASWIDQGRWVHDQVVRQLDAFHIARAAYRAAGKTLGAALSEALQAGDRARVQALWAQVSPPGEEAPQRQQQAWAWLAKHLDDPEMVRWWQGRIQGKPRETLGHIESYVRAWVAHRMKGKGRHWSAAGMRHMAKVRQVVWNGELQAWCGRHRRPEAYLEEAKEKPKGRRGRLRDDPGAWLQAHVPLLDGPLPTAPPWQRLRERLRTGHGRGFM